MNQNANDDEYPIILTEDNPAFGLKECPNWIPPKVLLLSQTDYHFSKYWKLPWILDEASSNISFQILSNFLSSYN